MKHLILVLILAATMVSCQKEEVLNPLPSKDYIFYAYKSNGKLNFVYQSNVVGYRIRASQIPTFDCSGLCLQTWSSTILTGCGSNSTSLYWSPTYMDVMSADSSIYELIVVE